MQPLARRALRLGLRIDAGGRSILGLSLKVQLRIHAERRRYSDAEAERLWELFGPPEHWGRSLGTLQWTTLHHEVGPFSAATTTHLSVPCSFEFGAAAPKYLAAIEGGLVPLELLFSGTMSWTASDGRRCTAMIPWDRDASFRMPVAVWHRLELGR